MNKEEFIKEVKKLGIELTEEQIEKLNYYKDFLIEYNEHTNLTAIKDDSGIYLKHFYDSLVISKYIKNNETILDIGTGAGFPGAVLAIIRPNTNFVLLDSNNKKIKFLQELKNKLKLNNIELVCARAEEYVKNNLEKFDIVTSRAVASLRILAEISLPALKINGLFIPLKANIAEELEEAKDTISILNGKIISKEEYTLPIENSKRTILIIEHNRKTNSKYPRPYNKILKNPLKNISK